MATKVSANTQKVDLTELSGRIFEVTSELGNLEGIAQERGYPDMPAARYVDCGDIVLQRFESHGPSIYLMREDLHKIYVRLRQISTDLTLLPAPEMTEITKVFERQIELLDEKRGRLEGSLRSFDQVLQSHRLLQSIRLDVQSLSAQIDQYKEGHLPVDAWDVLSDMLHDLEVQARVLYPEKKKGSPDACATQNEQRLQILQDLNELRLHLNLKHIKLEKEVEEDARTKIERLLLKLDEMQRHPKLKDSGEGKLEIQNLFGSLPLVFRIGLYSIAGCFPESLSEDAKNLFLATDKKVYRDSITSLLGASYFNRQRAEKEYFQEVADEPSRRMEMREASKKALNEELSKLPPDLISDPQLAKLAIEQTLADHPRFCPASVILKAVIDDDQGDPFEADMDSSEEGDRLEKAAASSPASDGAASKSSTVPDGGTPVVKEEKKLGDSAVKPQLNPQVLFESQIKNPPVFVSLEQLKEQIEAYKSATIWDPSQREQLVRALLEEAEKKGAPLNAQNGVYYWVWFLAHEKDTRAGGDNFGKVNAPKDLDRLLQAFERALPPKAVKKEETSLSTPVPSTPPVRIEVSSPQSPTLPSVQRVVNERRFSSPVSDRTKTFPPRSPNTSPKKEDSSSSTPSSPYLARTDGRAPKPSEIARSAAGVKAPPVKALFTPVVTEIKVKCRIPFGHTLTIRGQGGDLEWSKGKALAKLDDETYVYRMEGVPGKVEYKLVLDDRIYEEGPNHSIEAAQKQEIVPSLAVPKVPVVINFNQGGQKLFIRGTGPGMSWDKSLELKFVEGKFVLETHAEFNNFEFKLLLNDKVWSQGENFKAEKGKTLEFTPRF
ncbi:MAG: hypothetical protein JSS60_05435 [Verrucomicrobia bacterium]|nr:hypothetical protein [Verrucomicrobiota bacterium]